MDPPRLHQDQRQAHLPRRSLPQNAALPIPMDAPLPVFYANAAANGYYRTSYTPAQYTAIPAKAETALTPPERIGLLGDRWALVRSGSVNVGDFLYLVLALKQDPNADRPRHRSQQGPVPSNRIATDDDLDRLNCHPPPRVRPRLHRARPAAKARVLRPPAASRPPLRRSRRSQRSRRPYPGPQISNRSLHPPLQAR